MYGFAVAETQGVICSRSLIKPDKYCEKIIGLTLVQSQIIKELQTLYSVTGLPGSNQQSVSTSYCSAVKGLTGLGGYSMKLRL